MTRNPQTGSSVTTGAMLVACAITPYTLQAGEGGTSHVLPGANATLVDVLPTTPGWFLKPMYLNYNGSVSAQIPTAASMGPVPGYIKPLGTQSVAFELKWLTELDTNKRLEGDYVWLRMACKFQVPVK